jgi:hypothetical protein
MRKISILLMFLSLIFFSTLNSFGQAIHEYAPGTAPIINYGGQGGTVTDADGDWSSVASLPAATSTSGAACAYLNGKVYHFGGSPGPSADYLEWDEVGNTWTNLGTMPGGVRYYFSAETVNGKIYVIGGSAGWPTPTGLVEIFDGSTWTTGAPMPIPLKDIATGVYMDRYIYTVGGMIGSWADFSNAVQVYDTQTDTWAAGTNFLIAAGCMAGSIVGNIICVAGPYDGAQSNAIYEGEINVSDPTQITWTVSTATLRDAVYRSGGGSPGDLYINNYAFFVGGQSPYSNQAAWYDPATDTYTLWPNKPVPLGNIPNWVPGMNAMYVMGGYDGGYNLTCEGMEYTMIPIPVEFTAFTGSVNESTVTLSWETATETNNSGFAIERKSANTEYTQIGFVAGHGTTTEPQVYSFADANLMPDAYSYRLKQIDYDGTYNYSAIVEIEVLTPGNFVLAQNYPNPFNPSTIITFSLAADSKVSLKIFNALGQEVSTLVNENLSAGVYNYDFNATGINSGVYFYKIEAVGINGNEFVDIKKMTLVK